MSAKTTSWLSAHGRLWYDDPWYRLAWIIWPQALGLLLLVSLWLNYPAEEGFIPPAKPVVEAPKAPAIAAPLNAPPTQAPIPPRLLQPIDALGPCKGSDHAQAIRGCTTLFRLDETFARPVKSIMWLAAGKEVGFAI